MISVTEIILIIIGFIALVLGYFIPAGKGDGHLDPDEVDEMVQEGLDRSLNNSVRRTIDGMARDAVAEAVDDNRLDLSRISNEKVQEISEYAGTVLDDIKKNHDEVVFMYDMLNDKHKNLTNTVTEITRKAEDAKQTVRDAELTARDARDAAATLDAAAARARIAAETAPHMENRGDRPIIPVGVSGDKPGDEEEISTQAVPQAAEADEKLDDNGFAVLAPPVEEISETIPEAPVKTANTPNTAKQTVRRKADEPMSQNRQILEMHNAGKSNMVIARELGLGIGEVRLVIDLSKKQMKQKEG